MTPLIFSISLLVAFSAAGFVWYGWGLAENVGALLRRRRGPDEPEVVERPEEES